MLFLPGILPPEDHSQPDSMSRPPGLLFGPDLSAMVSAMLTSILFLLTTRFLGASVIPLGEAAKSNNVPLLKFVLGLTPMAMDS